jgi:hypothetical protein
MWEVENPPIGVAKKFSSPAHQEAGKIFYCNNQSALNCPSALIKYILALPQPANEKNIL